MHRTLPCAILYVWERSATKGEGHDRIGGGGGGRAEMERRMITGAFMRGLQAETLS